MATSKLWNKKKREYMKAVERHLKSKRITLKNIVGLRTVLHHNSSSFSLSSSSCSSSSSLSLFSANAAINSTTVATTTSTSTLSTVDGDYSDDGDVDMDIPPADIHPVFSIDSMDHSSLQFPEIDKSTTTTTLSTVPIHPFFNKLNATPLPIPTPPTLPPHTNIPASECDQVSFNKVCTLKLCQKCYSKSMEYCGVTTYTQLKPFRYQSIKYKKITTTTATIESATSLSSVFPGVVDHIANTMRERREVYITYTNHDPNEKRARKIKPFK
jgi:hypothetical protein